MSEMLLSQELFAAANHREGQGEACLADLLRRAAIQTSCLERLAGGLPVSADGHLLTPGMDVSAVVTKAGPKHAVIDGWVVRISNNSARVRCAFKGLCQQSIPIERLYVEPALARAAAAEIDGEVLR